MNCYKYLSSTQQYGVDQKYLWQEVGCYCLTVPFWRDLHDAPFHLAPYEIAKPQFSKKSHFTSGGGEGEFMNASIFNFLAIENVS